MKRLICIGGGEIRTRETILIDDYIAGEAKKIGRKYTGLWSVYSNRKP